MSCVSPRRSYSSPHTRIMGQSKTMKSRKVSPPKPYLNRFPPEIRAMIFKEAMVEEENASNLVAALLPLHRNSSSSVYTEALHIRFRNHPCRLRKENVSQLENLSEKVKESVQTLVLQFSLAQTIRHQRVLSCKLNRQSGAITSTEAISKAICATRINPKPSFLISLQPFPNIKRLRFESELVAPTSYHQIDGMIMQALKTHQHLERIEIRTQLAGQDWQYTHEDDEFSKRRCINHVNEGVGMDARIPRVCTSGAEELWVWQAAERETLSWKAAPAIPCLKRKRV